MTALRRHLFAATWMILSVHALGAVLGAAQVCREQEHTHGGVAAPDCPMHHQAETASPAVSHHRHHGGTSASDDGDSGTARLSCHCSGDALTMLLGQPAVLTPPTSQTLLVQAVVIDVLSDPLAVDLWFAPPSPPPR